MEISTQTIEYLMVIWIFMVISYIVAIGYYTYQRDKERNNPR